MRVAYDFGVPIVEPTGVSRYIRGLSKALISSGVDVQKYQVSLRGKDVDAVARWRRPARVMDISWRAFGRPVITDLVGSVDIVHGTNFILSPVGKAVGVLTIHDLSFRTDHGYQAEKRLNDMLPWSLNHSSIAIVPSQAIASEVLSCYGFPEDRIHVTPEGVDQSFFGAVPLDEDELKSLGITRPFAIAVGAVQSRKNLPRLVAAWNRVASRLREWTLVLVGPQKRRMVLPPSDGIVLTGWVGEETLHRLLAAADFFCYPSLYEGFGLPPLEAMAAGTPCLVGDYPAASEVVGDCALIVNRLDEGAIAEALVTLATDKETRQRLVQSGKERARRFTWNRTASLTISAYESALLSVRE